MFAGAHEEHRLYELGLHFPDVRKRQYFTYVDPPGTVTHGSDPHILPVW
jgi:hypothetical protein